MKNLLEREIKSLGEIKDKELVIYVTTNIIDDIESINNKLSNLISASSNMMRYLRELGVKNEDIYKDLKENYNDLKDLRRFKENALLVHKLLSGREVKIKDNNKTLGSVGYSDGKEKIKEDTKVEKQDEVKKDEIIDKSNPALTSKDITLAKVEVAKRIIKTLKDSKILNSKEKVMELYNTVKDNLPKDFTLDKAKLDEVNFDNMDGYYDIALGSLNTDKAHEAVDNVELEQILNIERYLNKYINPTKTDSKIFANVGYNPGLAVNEEPKTKIGLDINKLNSAASEMAQNLTNHVMGESVVTEEDSKKSKRQAAREKDTVVCNLCKDPACDRKPGDLHSKCLHYGKVENK